METKFKEQGVSVDIPKHLTNVNEQFWYAISKLREWFKQLDKNNELLEFWSEMPLSTVDIYTRLGMSKANFSNHFKAFLNYSKTLEQTITPLFCAGNVPYYRAGDAKQFEIFYNIKKTNILR